MLSSKWQSTKTSINLLIEATVGWGKGACEVLCVGMTELALQRWEVTETCQRSQSARGQPHYAVNPTLLFCGGAHWCKTHEHTDEMHSCFHLHPPIYAAPFIYTTSCMHVCMFTCTFDTLVVKLIIHGHMHTLQVLLNCKPRFDTGR